MTHFRKPLQRRSFTLLEVLIALGLALALLSTIFSFYFDLLNTRERLLERADQFRAASTLIDRLEAELLVSIAGNRSLEAGVQGTNTSLTIASRSVAASLAQRGALDRAVYSDMQITTFQFVASAQRIELTRWAEIDDQTRTTETLTEQIAQLRFRYYDGSRWTDAYNSIDSDALPQAVEISIWFESRDQQQETSADANARDGADPNTFDSEGGFDEFEFAMRDNRGFQDETLPDRFRVIRIPDAAKEQLQGEDQAATGAQP